MFLSRYEAFVSWRYLRARGHRAGKLWIIIGVVLFLLGIGLYVASARMPTEVVPPPSGTMNWKGTLEMGGAVTLIIGVLVGVFGFFFSLQSFFTTVSTYGVFLGTAALCIVLSVMNGFEVDLQQKILGSNAHMLITRDDGAFTDWREVRKKLEGVCSSKSCILGTTPYLSSEVVVVANRNNSAVMIKGIDPASVGTVTDLESNLKREGSLARMNPLAEDGGLLAPLADAGPVGDGQPDQAPPDFSGDAGPVDPDDLPPPDFSGGVDDGGDLDAGAALALVDAGAGDPQPPDFSRDSAGNAPLQAKPLDDDDLGDPRAGLLPDPDLLPIDNLGHDDPFASLRPRTLGRPMPILDPRVAGLDGVLVGRQLATDLNLWVGQEVQIVSPLLKDTPNGQLPRTMPLRVADSFFTGMYEYDTRQILVTLPTLQRFLSLGDEVTGIEIKVSDLYGAPSLVGVVQQRLGPSYRVQDWTEINRPLFSALKLEKIAMFLVLTIIILVASFSIISNLIMLVVEKAREIAILKSMGATDAGILRIFVFEGLFIGLLGTITGIIVGLAACWALGRFGLRVNPNVFYIEKLPVAMDPLVFIAVAIAGPVISVAATLYPSAMGARLKVVEGLRVS